MKKTIIMACVLTLSFVFNAHAGSTSLNEYGWGNPNTGTTARGDTTASVQQYTPSLQNTIDEFGNPITPSAETPEMCTQLCPGYSSSIVDCPEGYEIKTCNVSNCYNYNKCEASPCKSGYDRKSKDCPIIAQPDNYHCTKCK